MNSSVLLLLAAIALVFAARVPPPGPTICSGVDCTSCTTVPGCAWCRNMQKCYTNNSAPCVNNEECVAYSNTEEPPMCPQQLCSAYTDCASCTSDAACGWCSDNSKCYESVGCPDCLPSGASCKVWKAGGSDRTPPESDCTISTACTTYMDCQSCNTDPSCGWCASTMSCTLGYEDMQCNNICEACYSMGDPVTTCPANHSKCAAYTDCYNCVSEASCGWCPTSMKCSESTDFGPCTGSCAACFVESGETDSCPQAGFQCSDWNNDCAGCTAQNGCGYCPETGMCTFGTEFNQCSGSCPACWQVGDEATCPDANSTCADYKDCAGCTAQFGCGWCPTSNQCSFGTDFGPCSGSCESCWQFGDDVTCPAPHTTCSNYTDCASCTAQDACGWCPTSNACLFGTEEGPCSGSCAACWQYGSDSECPALGTTCSTYKDCASCTDQEGCGWCGATQTCSWSSGYGPCSGSCATCWQNGEDSACPAPGMFCSNYTDCASCTAQSCGWCPITETCSQTDSYNKGILTFALDPCSGSCSACYTTSSDSCPSSGSCPDFKSASQCNAEDGCVWCTNSNSCVWGTAYSTCTGATCTTA